MKSAKKKQSVYVFIDASNIIYSARSAGWKVDYEKLIHYLKTRYDVSRVIYYAGVDNENIKQLGFYEKLVKLGFELRLVPMKKFSDGRKKADCDARMTFEAMKYFKEYNEAIFLTGDGDFFWLLEYLLKKKNGMVKLIAQSRNTARELKILFRDKFIHLENLRQLIERKERKK